MAPQVSGIADFEASALSHVNSAIARASILEGGAGVGVWNATRRVSHCKGKT